MQLVSSNENGRVYIDNFTLCKGTYKFLKSNFSNIHVRVVKFDNSVLEIYISNRSNLNIKTIKQLQNFGRKLIEENYGIYVNQINVIVG